MRTAASARSSPASEAARLLILAAVAGLSLSSCCTPPPPPPPPPPEAPAREQVVSWQVDPADGFRPETGFVTLEYLPPERLAGTDDPPPGGRLTVHLGDRSIVDANTVWYRFEVLAGARRLLEFEGEEGIPNVKDHDGYWWNDVDLDLEEPVADAVRVVVTDTRDGAAYPFTLRRVVTYK